MGLTWRLHAGDPLVCGIWAPTNGLEAPSSMDAGG